MVIIPITGILFPAAGITGVKILIFSVVPSILGMLAPSSYSFIGSVIGMRFKQNVYFSIFNKLMAAMLAAVSVLMFYDHVYLALFAS